MRGAGPVDRETTLHPSGDAVPPSRRRLGDMLLEEGLISATQLRDALRIQRETVPHQPLGEILVEQRLITREQLRAILKKYRRRYLIGDMLVERNVITEDQLQIALQHQKQTRSRLGDALLALKLLTEEELKRALCEQSDVTFVDLDEVVVDPGVAQLINPTYAQRHRVIPIARAGDRLTLAIDDPADVALMAELAMSTGCRIEAMTSTQAAFDRAFLRAYGVGPSPESPRERDEERPVRQDTRADYQAGSETVARPLAGERDSEAHDRELLNLRHRLKSTAEALADLRAAHETLRREHEASMEALHRLNEQYRAVVQDRQRAADDLEMILRRLAQPPSPPST
jgi:type II secretion system (T2SS) protein E